MQGKAREEQTTKQLKEARTKGMERNYSVWTQIYIQ